MILPLLTLVLPLINAQCSTLGGTCKVCTTPLQTVNAATLADCHISSPTLGLLYVANNDIRGILQQWRSYVSTLGPTQVRNFCPYVDQGKKVGCFLYLMDYGSKYTATSGGTADWWRYLYGLTAPVSTIIEAIARSPSVSDSDYMTMIKNILVASNGKHPFPSLAAEFLTYSVILSRASSNWASMQEHIIYTYWTLLPSGRLTSSENQKYALYQSLGGGTLPRKRQVTSTNVLSVEVLRSLCPLANTYLSVGCLFGVASSCQADDPGCKSYFINGIAYSYQSEAKRLITAICPIVGVTFPRICAKVSTF